MRRCGWDDYWSSSLRMAQWNRMKSTIMAKAGCTSVMQ